MRSASDDAERGGRAAALTGRRHRPAHRAPRNTHRGAMTAAGVLVALGAAVTTFALVGPGGSLNGAGTGLGASRQPTSGADEPSPVAGAARLRSCWDGAEVTVVRDCGVPAGEAGLASVFAGVDEECTASQPLVAGKVEVLTCRAPDHVVRYTRWTEGFDRFSFFDAEHASSGGRWLVDGGFAGRRWTAAVETADGVTHYRWTATYRAWPLSVEVQATTARGRAAGVAQVGAVQPSLVGLR